MDHVAGGQPIAAREARLARRTEADRPALGEEARACRAVDRPIDATAAKQRGVCRVDDRVDREPCDVAALQPNPVIRRQSCIRGQAGAHRGHAQKETGTSEPVPDQVCGWQTRDRETLPSRTMGLRARVRRSPACRIAATRLVNAAVAIRFPTLLQLRRDFRVVSADGVMSSLSAPQHAPPASPRREGASRRGSAARRSAPKWRVCRESADRPGAMQRGPP